VRVPPSLLLGLGVAAPPTAWFATQQAAGTLTYFACEASGPPVGLLVDLAGLAACLAAGALNWRSIHAEQTHGVEFGPRVGLGLAAIFALTNLVLDLLVLVVLFGNGLAYFASITVWLAYLLLLVVPWLTGRSLAVTR